MPKLIYGTAWKGSETSSLVYQAVEAGFRAFDTAAQPKHYSEHLVGAGLIKAIRAGLVTRQDLWVRHICLIYYTHLMCSNMLFAISAIHSDVASLPIQLPTC